MTQTLTEVHNGSISLENKPCSGSRFTVSLPLIDLKDEPDRST